MPDRLFRLAATIRTCQGGLACRSAHSGSNDNARAGLDEARPPEPVWPGPGRILSLGVQDGRHRLGSVRVSAPEGGEATQGLEGGLEVDVLHRLLVHYGLWLGFQGQVTPVAPGHLRHLPDAARTRGRVEYRLDLSRIVRSAQSLTADGTILIDGRPAVVLEGLTITFRATGQAGAPRRVRKA